MTSAATLWNRHWRIVTVAAVGAILAFVGSFLVDPTYTSSTRLLIHGRDATFLSSTGQDLANQPGVIDSSLSQSLASTYAGIATSRAVAETVVEDLALDDRPAKTGPIAMLAGAAAWVYRCGRAFITAGYCAPVDPYEKAVAEVQEGTSAMPLGSNAGASAGTTGSYVLEVASSGRSPEEAKAVTDAVADQLVLTSASRFATDSTDVIARLETLSEQAEQEVTQRSLELANFQTANGITAADGDQVLSATSHENLSTELVQAQAQAADLQAQLASISQSLRSTPQNTDSSQTIVTGRSTTEMNSQATNPVYNDLLIQQRSLQAQLDGQLARVDELQRALDGAAALADNATAAELASLAAAVTRAQQNLADVERTLHESQLTAAQGPTDLTRLDEAAAPPYPAEPKRYIYLALGLLIGAVAGAVLAAQARRREGSPIAPPDESGPVGTGNVESEPLANVPDPEWEPVGAARSTAAPAERTDAPATSGGRSGNGYTTRRPSLSDRLFVDDV